MRSIHGVGWLFLASAVVIGSPCRVHASPSTKDTSPWHNGGVYMGGFLTQSNNTITAGVQEYGTGIAIDLEDAFGLDSTQTVYRAGAYYRFGETKRHRVDLDFFARHSKNSKVLETDISYNGTTFPAGSELSSEFSTQVIKLSYGYSFIHDDRVDLAATFGLYVVPFSVKLQGLTTNESTDVIAPLPVFGLRGGIVLAEDLILRENVDLFYLQYGRFSGSVSDVYLGLEWEPWDHFGFGLGLDSFRVRVEAESADYPGVDFTGKFQSSFTGLLFYVTYSF